MPVKNLIIQIGRYTVWPTSLDNLNDFAGRIFFDKVKAALGVIFKNEYNGDLEFHFELDIRFQG